MGVFLVKKISYPSVSLGAGSKILSIFFLVLDQKIGSKQHSSSNHCNCNYKNNMIRFRAYFSYTLFTIMITSLTDTTTNAFVVRPSNLHKPSFLSKTMPSLSTTELSVSSWGDDFYSRDPLQRNMVRTNVGNFLTQRSIQSFMFLLEQVRDPHSIQWIEDNFCDCGMTVQHFHGTGAFNLTIFPSWDCILLDMMSMPVDTIQVKTKKRSPYQGSRKNAKPNPYLEDRFIEFDIDIDPVSLASRIISVREQLAREWVDDFDVIIHSTDMILTSYFDKSMDARDDEEDFSLDADKEGNDDENKATSLTGPSSKNKDNVQDHAFDRRSMMMLMDRTAFQDKLSSPLRKGNFDLLLLLTTQESVHRVLRKYKEAGKERAVAFEALLDFYKERIPLYFDGHQQSYGRADDFLEELLLKPPSVTSNVRGGSSGEMGFIDPLAIATDIIRTRSEVSSEWKDMVENVPHDHLELRKELFTRQMAKYGQHDNDANKNKEIKHVEQTVVVEKPSAPRVTIVTEEIGDFQ